MPYLLSYIFMVFILQTASGILTEASISLLGLGPYDSVSLGKILNEAVQNEALSDGAWWAFAPAALLITVIAFALYIISKEPRWLLCIEPARRLHRFNFTR